MTTYQTLILILTILDLIVHICDVIISYLSKRKN